MRVPPGSQLVFDQVVFAPSLGTNPPVTSDSKFNDWLGRPNDLRLFGIVDRVTSGAGTIVVSVEESADEERGWATSMTFPAAAAVAGTTTTTLFTGSDTEATRGRPSLAYRRISVYAIVEGTNPVPPLSARVRIWVAGRNGYRRFHRLLLTERMQGTGQLFGPLEACSLLASADQFVLAAYTDEVSGELPTLTFLLGESPNGRTWGPGISSVPLSIAPGPPQIVGIPIGLGRPWSGFARFGVQLGHSDDAATVRLWVTGRDIRSG